MTSLGGNSGKFYPRQCQKFSFWDWVIFFRLVQHSTRVSHWPTSICYQNKLPIKLRIPQDERHSRTPHPKEISHLVSLFNTELFLKLHAAPVSTNNNNFTPISTGISITNSQSDFWKFPLLHLILNLTTPKDGFYSFFGRFCFHRYLRKQFEG